MKSKIDQHITMYFLDYYDMQDIKNALGLKALSYMSLCFYDKQLFRMYLGGSITDQYLFDDIKYDCERLTHLFNGKYGSPAYYNPSIGRSNLEDNKGNYLYFSRFEISYKTIDICMKYEHLERSYSFEVEINNSNFTPQISDEDKKKKEVKERAKEKIMQQSL